MKKLAALLALLISTEAYGGTFSRYGVGVFNSARNNRAEVKMISIGYQEPWFGSFFHQLEAGAWIDSAGSGRTGSGFGAAAIGTEVVPGDMVFRSSFGIGAITSPDAYLGGWFQFNQDLFAGVRDRKGAMIGLNYKHISSGGIYQPNQGRDFLMVHVEIPW